MAYTTAPISGGGGGTSDPADDDGGTSDPSDSGGSTSRDPVDIDIDWSDVDRVNDDSGGDDPADSGGSSGGSAPTEEEQQNHQDQRDADGSPATQTPEDTANPNAGQGASTHDGAADNRLAAMYAQITASGGSQDAAGGSTADTVIGNVVNSPDRVTEQIEGAREQYQTFRENNPVSEIVDNATDNATDNTPDLPDDVSGLAPWKLAVAGATVLLGGFAVLGGN